MIALNANVLRFRHPAPAVPDRIMLPPATCKPPGLGCREPYELQDTQETTPALHSTTNVKPSPFNPIGYTCWPLQVSYS